MNGLLLIQRNVFNVKIIDYLRPFMEFSTDQARFGEALSYQQGGQLINREVLTLFTF